MEHGVPPIEPEPGVVAADAGFARVTVRTLPGLGEIEIACDDPGLMVDLRIGIDQHMAEFAPDLPPLAWSGADAAGTLPPSFAAARVAGCEPLGISWLRMTLAAEPAALRRFAVPHWHFRLLRPMAAGRVPIWPRLNPRGTLDWPAGEDTLLDRAYTVRDLDIEGGTLAFDIFRHEGGHTCTWAEAAPAGEAVGLIGPGGKTGPEVGANGGWLLSGGDETSAPVILRALSVLPAGTRGQVVLLVADAADRQPVPTDGPAVTWLYRSEGATEADLVDAVASVPVPAGNDTWLWFAASQEAARKIRRHGRDVLSVSRDRLTSVAYWQG